ncbi:fumarylacetoacetate hydrolase family protein [uncultured Amnibacterium sp.]|uniref:fumarylacetoacetate hydrolase family protein n=1 Tax=uncultured Amnibacterium sp. TaxID=1631851 RepID=UPI0035CB278C
MRYASYESDGIRGVAEVVDDLLVPLDGVAEIDRSISGRGLADAERKSAEALPLASVTLLPVVPNPSKIFCVGLNYLEHVQETRRELPTYPVLFPKFASSLIGAGDPIVLPPESDQVDYEGELAVIIGTAGRRIDRGRALDHVLGYAVANDVTMRDYQYKTHQWLQGKAWDDSTPVGPFLVTPDEVDLTRARIRTILNGAVVQDSDLSKLIFPIEQLISLISEFTALNPGDIILTGTPGGVGFRRDPQVFLHDGDVVVVDIEGVGALTSNVAGGPAKSRSVRG